jgi:peptidoglycan/xylan/chitin deacetylase (PgdA/CDA1 family)
MKTKIGLVFDDGFAKSSIDTARIFEQYKLPALFAVLSDPSDFAPRFVKGDFHLWNDLQSAGHKIHPHGHTHANMPSLPYADATKQIDLCLSTFQEKLNNFDPKKVIYHFTYNLGTPALNEYLLPKVAISRNAGTGFLTNEDLSTRVWRATSYGPEDPYNFVRSQLDVAKQFQAPAFFMALHGLDGEAWGATSSDNLKRLLDRITTDPELEYWSMP